MDGYFGPLHTSATKRIRARRAPASTLMTVFVRSRGMPRSASPVVYVYAQQMLSHVSLSKFCKSWYLLKRYDVPNALSGPKVSELGSIVQYWVLSYGTAADGGRVTRDNGLSVLDAASMDFVSSKVSEQPHPGKSPDPAPEHRF